MKTKECIVYIQVLIFIGSRLQAFQPANDESHMLPVSPAPQRVAKKR